MYGKHFESMYTGSLRGAGAHVFAVMGYIVAHQKPPDFCVELNPELVAFLLGEPIERINEAIEKLCAPDPKSRNDKEDGRRIVRIGAFLYRVVNGPHYYALRSQEEKRAYWREMKRKQSAETTGIEKEKPEKQPKRPEMVIPPSMQDMELFAAKIGLPPREVEKFNDWYESNGWRVGKNKMTNWQRAMNRWKLKWEEDGRPGLADINPMDEQAILRLAQS